MADFTIHLMAYELDKKRKRVAKTLERRDLKTQTRIRLEGMQAGLVWARAVAQEIAETAEKLEEN